MEAGVFSDFSGLIPALAQLSVEGGSRTHHTMLNGAKVQICEC